MLSERLGQVLHRARKLQKLTRDDLARAAGVSTRLVAELERGERPNVSLESALQLLSYVGVAVVATAPDGLVERIADRQTSSKEFEARAAVRRRTWTGGRVNLHDPHPEPHSGRSSSKRVTAVSAISGQAFALIKKDKRDRRKSR
jgi:transcriptional regulator with XRE-family HTH domain